ncbi:MAG: hypothetical protein ACM3SU_03650 [Acidobacteriota bacterium]
MHRQRLFLGIGLGILLVGAAGAAAPGDLSGTWKLNRDASDDPRRKMEEARAEGGRSGGSGWRGRHGGHRGGGDFSGDRASPGDTEPPAEADTIRIDHQDPGLVITDGAGREHVLYTDGRKLEEERSFGGTTKITARWKDGHVVVEAEPERGPSYTETYAVTADHKQLTVTRHIKGRGRRGDIEIRRVYDAVSPDDHATPPPAPANARPASAGEACEGAAPGGPVRLES